MSLGDRIIRSTDLDLQLQRDLEDVVNAVRPPVGPIYINRTQMVENGNENGLQVDFNFEQDYRPFKGSVFLPWTVLDDINPVKSAHRYRINKKKDVLYAELTKQSEITNAIFAEVQELDKEMEQYK